MTDILDPLPNERILSLLLTLQCTAQCAHCGTYSGPHVKKRLSHDKARLAIEQAHTNGYKLVVFTGGEPMLYGPELYNLIEGAAAHGLRTRVVTNAFWAQSESAAHNIAHKLKCAGLQEINFSTGDEHAKFIPIRNIIYASNACLKLEFPVSIMIEVVANNDVTVSSITSDPLFKELIGDARGRLLTFCESPWMPLDEFQTFEYPERFASNTDTVRSRPGCDSVINTTTVLADGRIMACCGLGTQSIPELHVGDIDKDNFTAIDTRLNDDFMKRWIKIEGPEKILAWAATKDASITWENMYAHRCQACKRLHTDSKIRAVINEHHEEKMVDVLLEEWLLFNYKYLER